MGPLLAFDLVGPMAHFRRFYTNSSSLSYPLPPRTTLAGLLAGLLGRERDGHYREFAPGRARIGVALGVPVRTLMQTVNYLQTKEGGWDGGRGHTQIPLEWVLPQPPEPFLRYRVYFAHEDGGLVEELHGLLQDRRYRYPPYLGLTECPAWAEEVRLYPPGAWALERDPPGELPLRTAVPLERVVGGIPLREGLRLYKDRMPLAFGEGRVPVAVGEVLWEAEGRPLPLRVRGVAFHAPEEGWGVFLEVGDGV